MYQNTIRSEKGNQHYINYLCNQISPALRQINGVSAVSCADDTCCLSFACDESYKKQISDTVASVLADIFSVGYKNQYFKQKLCINSEDFFQNAVINTMCIFDTHKDKRAITKDLSSIDNLSIEGYCNFRLREVKDKWDEIINVTNAYDIVKSNSVIIKDFLIFLVDSVPYSHSTVSVALSNEGFTIFDERNVALNPYTFFSANANSSEVLLHNLICRKAKHVVFIGKASWLTKDFWSTVRLLFNIREYKR